MLSSHFDICAILDMHTDITGVKPRVELKNLSRMNWQEVWLPKIWALKKQIMFAMFGLRLVTHPTNIASDSK